MEPYAHYALSHPRLAVCPRAFQVSFKSAREPCKLLSVKRLESVEWGRHSGGTGPEGFSCERGPKSRGQF